MSEFVVEVKQSARRTNGAVGAAVVRRGSRRRFRTRADAESWAASLSGGGEPRVWIRLADPRDDSDTDGYLVGRRCRVALDGAYDKRRRRLRGGTDAEQSGFDRF
ncbi:hypothetical protein AUR64_08055 [Haloprofundus marisrubri]|uniref:DUF8081 domain-containing protein n=1 Tax=Haloprofundus marisrubri TaxID=1514971 RepID=A0A0W1RB96_9EURY|nr:hypothetical protein [Haloprofundus marisrubri]KTG10663.1 hypothetical protein AUR64_08055 [Haloprofundus marisrubri]